MRLVGASSWYIQLPFLLEALFAALAGVALASLSLIAFMAVVIYGLLGDSTIVPWVSWQDSVAVMTFIAALGVAMTLLPTLLLTRRYLKV
jgi:cell division transport system permease protein